MSAYWNQIRTVGKTVSIKRQIFEAAGILLLGMVLGIFSKYLDTVPSNELPFWMEAVDLSNFLGQFGVWIWVAVCISVYSRSPIRAGLHVFLFFAGMIACYYLYSYYGAGFFPKRYAMIWVGYTVISPFLAAICWYAKGKGWAAVLISAGILAVLFNTAFVYGWLYFDIRSGMEAAVFFLGILVLRRNVRETAIMLGLGVGIALCMHWAFPISF